MLQKWRLSEVKKREEKIAHAPYSKCLNIPKRE